MSLNFTAKILFDDKEKAPIRLITDANINIVKEKIDELFQRGYVVVDAEGAIPLQGKEGYSSVLKKYYSLDEVDHIELIEEFEPDDKPFLGVETSTA